MGIQKRFVESKIKSAYINVKQNLSTIAYGYRATLLIRPNRGGGKLDVAEMKPQIYPTIIANQISMQYLTWWFPMIS